MAGLKRARERGQLLVVASVAFAVILIALALAANTAVYGNVHVAQTDSGSFEERTALQYESDSDRGISALLPLIVEDGEDPGDTLGEEAGLWETLTQSEYARDGVATDVSVDPGVVQDRIVHDNETRAFNNSDDEPDWDVVNNVTDDVVYKMTIGNESLADGENDEFTINVNEGNWTLSAFSTAESEIVVEIRDGTGGTEQYKTNRSSVRIDVANGIFNVTGDQEEFTSFIDDDDVEADYDIRYENGNNANGTYHLFEGTLDIENLEVVSGNYATGAEESPRVVDQVASAEITVNYRSTELRYQNTIEVQGGVYDDDE